MPNFVTITGQFATDLEDTSKFTTRSYTLLVDTNGDGDLLDLADDLTSYLHNGVELSGSGQLEGSSNEAVSNRWTATLKNNDGTFTEGDYAGALCAIEAAIGSETAVRIFTGYVTDEGISVRRVGQNKVATLEMRDASAKLARRTMSGTLLANYKISDGTTPATSLVHYLASQLGIDAADVDAGTITDTKDLVELKHDAKPWAELQDLAQQFLAVLRFDADGTLVFESPFESGYSTPTVQWTFVDGANANIAELEGRQDPITVNRCRTKYDDYESLGSGSGYTIYKNTENYDADTDQISIVVPAGEYWPGESSATDVATLNYKDPDSGEKLLATTVITPTIGTSGSEDIVCSGGTLTLTSFNGSTSATTQYADGSQIILYNGTASAITITRFRIRGTAYRVGREVVVEELDATVSNEYDYVTKEIPGKYAVSHAQAGETCNWWVERGKTPRKRYRIKTYWLPHVVEGAYVNITLADGTDIDCQVERWTHSKPRKMATAETTLEVREVFAHSYATSPGVQINDVSSPVGSSVREAQARADNSVTYTELEEGYDSGVVLGAPTLRATIYNRNVHLEWDRQRALQNLDYYEVQRKPSGGSYSTIRGASEDLTDANTIDVPAFDVSGGNPIDTTYVYRVRRVTANPTDQSPWSNEASATIEPIKAGELVAAAITEAKIADDAVTTAKIINDAVTSALIAAGAVDTDQLAADAVVAAKIAAGTITANEIATNAITADKILASAVTTAKLAAGAVTANEIAANAVTAAKILADTITASELATSGNFLFTGAIGSETAASPSDGDVRTYHGKDPAGAQTSSDPFEFAIKRYNGTAWEYIAKIGSTPSGDNADGLIQGNFNVSGAIGSLWGNFWKDVGVSWSASSGGGIAYDGTTIIAVSAAGTTVYYTKSTDNGDTWSAGASTTITVGRPTQMVSPASGVFVASCQNDGIVRTTNSGTSWTELNPGGSSEHLWGIAAGDTYLVAVGDNGTIVYSDDDGATWSTVGTTTFGTDDVKGVGFGNGRFIAVGGASSSDSHVAYADESDITSWTEITTHGLGSNLLESALWVDEIWTISGYGGSIAYSDDDGATWTSVGPGVGTFIEQAAVQGYRVVTSGSSAYYSVDNGRSWRQHPGFPDTIDDFAEADDGRVFVITLAAGDVYEGGWAEAGAGIVARGENSNGTYIKFSDGTMVCLGAKNLTFDAAVNYNIGTYGISYNSLSGSITMPETFVTAPVITGGGSQGVSSRGTPFWVTPVNITTTGATLNAGDNGTGGVDGATWVAIGRWY